MNGDLEDGAEGGIAELHRFRGLVNCQYFNTDAVAKIEFIPIVMFL